MDFRHSSKEPERIKDLIISKGYGPALTASVHFTIAPYTRSTVIARDLYEQVPIESSPEGNMGNSVTRTATKRALNLVSTTKSLERVDDNYTIWGRSLEITLLTSNIAWKITDDLVISDKFPTDHKQKLVEPMLNHIEKSISQPIQHKLICKVDATPKVVLDQIESILAEKTPVRHEKHRLEACRIVCSNDFK